MLSQIARRHVGAILQKQNLRKQPLGAIQVSIVLRHRFSGP
jgi:hypothetical protein